VNSALKEDFIRIDIADSRYGPLVHEQRLDRTPVPGQYFPEFIEIDADFHGIRAEALLLNKIIHGIGMGDPAEFAPAIVGQTVFILEFQQQPDM
jgi:hypothetical protein